MPDVARINTYLQERLTRERLHEVPAVEAAQWLARERILRDDSSKPGLPLRKLLRNELILGQIQRPNRKNGRWFIQNLQYAKPMDSQTKQAQIAEKPSKTHKDGFAPIANASANILILGTLPGDLSLRAQQYYANSGNQFWRILSAMYDDSIPENYNGRTDWLRQKGLALWDVLSSAERVGSSDAKIQKEVPNDIPEFVRSHRHLTMIAFNGKKAKNIHDRYFAESYEKNRIAFALLPSSSGALAIPLEEKVRRWKLALSR